MNQSHNLAARAARWSASHRKAAIWGWGAFVVLAVVLGSAVGQNKISAVDQFNGESQRAEQALDRAGLRPVSEAVLVQSDKLTIADPRFRAAVSGVTERLSRVPYVEKLESPLTAAG